MIIFFYQNWSDTSKSVYKTYFNILHDFGLEQVVKEPTRHKPTLDLFLTNQQSQHQNTPPLGFGDHDIVHHDINILS